MHWREGRGRPRIISTKEASTFQKQALHLLPGIHKRFHPNSADIFFDFARSDFVVTQS